MIKVKIHKKINQWSITSYLISDAASTPREFLHEELQDSEYVALLYDGPSSFAAHAPECLTD